MSKYLKHILIIFIALLLGFSLGTSNNLMLLIGISLIMSVFMFSNVRITIYALFLSVFFLEWLWGYLLLLPKQITWLPEVLSMILLVRIMFDLATGKIQIKNNFITYFVYIWLFVSVIGIAVNSVKPPVFLAGFRNYFKFIPLLLAFSWYSFPEKFIKRVIYFIITIAVIQIFFVIPEKIIFWGQSGDLIVGSLGASASGTLAIFQLLVFSVLVGLYKSNYYSLKKFIIYGGLVLLSTFITEAKVVFFLLPIIFFVYLLDFHKGAFVKGTLTLIAGLVVFVLGIYIYNSIYAEAGESGIQTFIFSPERSLDELGATGELAYGKAGELRRASTVQFMFQGVNKNIYTKIFGVGVGNASDSFFPVSKGEYHKKYPLLNIDKVFWARLGWEFGYIGLLLFLMFFFLLFNVRHHRDYGTFYNGLFLGLKGLAIVTLASFIYNSFLIMNPLAVPFWLYLGALNNKLLTEKYSVHRHIGR